MFFVEGQKYYGKCAAQAQEDENGGRSGRHRKGGSERGEKGEARPKDGRRGGVEARGRGRGRGRGSAQDGAAVAGMMSRGT